MATRKAASTRDLSKTTTAKTARVGTSRPPATGEAQAPTKPRKAAITSSQAIAKSTKTKARTKLVQPSIDDSDREPIKVRVMG